MKNLKIKIIIGSTREKRFGEKPALWLFEEAKKIKGVEVELLDLRDYPMAFIDTPASVLGSQAKKNSEIIKKWSAKIAEGDAFIIVTPEYNHGYPAALKNALDVIYSEWNRKAVGFVSYGGVGGARAVEQLRQVVIELQMAPIREAIHLPFEIFTRAQKENDPSKLREIFNIIRQFGNEDKVSKFFEELCWWAKALKKARGG